MFYPENVAISSFKLWSFFFFFLGFWTLHLQPSRPFCYLSTFLCFFSSLSHHPSCIFAHLPLPADLVVVVQWSGLSICSQLSTYIDLCHCVYALDQLLFTIHEIPAKKKKKKKQKKKNDKPLAQCCRMSINPDEKSRQLFSNQHILF